MTRIISILNNKKIIIFAGIIIILIIAFWNGLVIRSYTVKSNKLNSDIKIVLITDLHSYIYGKNQKQIADKIRKLSPDLILLGGDIADDGRPIDGTKQFLSAIQDIAKIYYVTGNHEFWSNDIENIKAIIRSYGVIILENNFDEININGNNIIIGGVDDPDINMTDQTNSKWENDVRLSFEQLAIDNRYKILLSHRPEKTTLYAELPFDLILSGHSHGGQVRIPFILNGLLAPNQGFFPKYAGGLYEYSGKIHIVSRGVSFSPKLPRVFNPPEIVVVTLKSH